MSSPFAFDSEDALSGGAVLQRELADDPTERSHFYVPNRRGGLTEEQQEGVEPGGGHHSAQDAAVVYLDRSVRECVPVDDPPVDHFQDDDPLCAVLQELRQFVL